MNEYFQSWPALLSTVLLIVALIAMLLFRDEIGAKIRSMTSLGGQKGAEWSEIPKGKLPENDLGDIRDEHARALGKLEELESENDALIEFVTKTADELEGVKTELFFERILSALNNWQYLVFKLLYEAKGNSLPLAELRSEVGKVYTDFNDVVPDEWLGSALVQFHDFELISVIKPLTDSTPITLAPAGREFVEYVNQRV